MNVFLSWSGDKSQAIAALLHAWLPRLIPAAKPWMSASDIPSGARWTDELTTALRSSDAAIMLLTSSNLSSSWLLYEAGVLSAVCGDGRVTPLLLDISAQSVPGPLSHFQAVQCDRVGISRLIASLSDRQVTSEVATLATEVSAALAQFPPPRDPRPAVRYITRSEMAVLEGVAAGKSARQIAGEMGISLSTVRTFVANLRAKFQASSAAQLILHAREEGLLEASEA